MRDITNINRAVRGRREGENNFIIVLGNEYSSWTQFSYKFMLDVGFTDGLDAQQEERGVLYDLCFYGLSKWINKMGKI